MKRRIRYNTFVPPMYFGRYAKALKYRGYRPLRRSNTDMTARERIAQWIMMDDHWPPALRAANNEFDQPQFWVEIYDLSFEAYGDDRALQYCLKELREYIRRHPGEYFVHDLGKCTSICSDIIFRMDDRRMQL